MNCALSGEIASDPVISPRSGAIFERLLVEKYVSSSGTDPITDEPLSVDDLIPVNVQSAKYVAPKPPAFNSIPSMLSTFQNEWDSLALEVFTLRKQLHKSREELSAALYHQDAAVRVAARAIKERDEAKQALQELSIAIGTSGSGSATSPVIDSNGKEKHSDGQVENAMAPPAELISKARESLFLLHKSQKPSLPVASNQQISIKFNSSISSHPFKKVSASYYNSKSSTLVLGSSTGAIALIRLDDNNSLVKYSKSAHKGMDVGSILMIQYEEEIQPIVSHLNGAIIIGDNLTKFPRTDGDKLAISSLIRHPSVETLFIIVYENGSWSLNDSSKLQTLYKNSSTIAGSVTSSDIHVDGALLALGNNLGEILIFDLATGSSISSIKSQYQNISSIKFAMNGYWLLVASASESESSSLEVFDLRKEPVSIHSIEFTNKIVDFFIDPSSTVIITLDSSDSLSLHRYTKKGKVWSDRAFSIEVDTALHGLQLVTSAETAGFKESGEVKFVGVGQNSSVLEYQLEYSS
ncbi:pre-mRNA-processing factor 19 [[Candida] railenensis]|uniref:Pre-mRNA-processing factor 19 n=1 Tax=[Candida] railenensis TaxID=45579 RepID=A0A9P0W068_9ASCO|nr:pre-mRNA-processing factor 19 [[Candida] railenensis]